MNRSTANFEVRLAATIRDYMRARDAGDHIAARFGAERICHGLGCLLNARLENVDGWDTHERWIDGMIGSRVVVLASDHLRVSGHMVWGLLANVGGPQWAEPFEADLTIGWETHDLAQYSLRFGDQRRLDDKRVTPGLYDVLAGSDDPVKSGVLRGSIGCSPAPGESRDQRRLRYPPEQSPGSWLYEFQKAKNPPSGTPE